MSRLIMFLMMRELSSMSKQAAALCSVSTGSSPILVQAWFARPTHLISPQHNVAHPLDRRRGRGRRRHDGF